MNAWLDQLYATFIATNYYKKMLEGLGNTLTITAGALIIGVLIGTLIAVIKYFAEDSAALKPFAFLCDVYITVIRGVPVVVLLLVFYFIIFTSASNGIYVAILTFGINSGAYMAELIRSGLNAVDAGQAEAARSLGLSKIQTMQKVVFPQAIRYILPAIGNEMIALLKETSVAGYVGEVDLTRAGNIVKNITFDAVNPLLIVAVTYLVMVFGLSQILGHYERRMTARINSK